MSKSNRANLEADIGGELLETLLDVGLLEVRDEPHLVWTTKPVSAWPKRLRDPYRAAKPLR